jgi:hypothetical protein
MKESKCGFGVCTVLLMKAFLDASDRMMGGSGGSRASFLHLSDIGSASGPHWDGWVAFALVLF